MSALPRSDGQGLEKLPWIRDTRFDTAEKTRDTIVGSHSSYGKKLYLVSSAVSPSPRDSCPAGFQQDHTTPQSFIVQVYAPTSDHDDKEVEQYYQQLYNTIGKTPKMDTCSVTTLI